MMAGAAVSCSDPEPTHNLSEDDVAAFCPPALDWFEIYRDAKQARWRLGSVEWLEAEAEALAALDPVIQPGWQDRFENDLRTELADVVDDVDRRLAEARSGNADVFQPNVGRVAASLNNFVLDVCERS